MNVQDQYPAELLQHIIIGFFFLDKSGGDSDKNARNCESEESFQTLCELPEETGSPGKQQHPG